MKTSTQQIILISLFALSTIASHTGIETLDLPLAEGESRTYKIVQALKSRDLSQDAQITFEGDRITVSDGECSFGGQIVGEFGKHEFAFAQDQFNKSLSMCSGALGDVQLMIQDLFDMKKGYMWRAKVFSSEWLVIGWNSATEGKVDLLVGQNVIPSNTDDINHKKVSAN